MSLNIGDNFKYLGKKFLDERESFDTLEEMNACNDVPKGFITICYENDKRYEFNGTTWVEYTINSSGESSDINMDDVIYYGTEEPTNDNVIWFYPNNNDYQGITIDNPIITELMSIIQNMQSQIRQLQADVEYLKTHGGGGGTTPDIPDIPDIPDTPDTPGTTYSYLLLEDGSKLLLEDGGGILLEQQEQQDIIKNSSYLLLENGYKLLLEDGGGILLEKQEQQDIIKNSSYLLLEDGYKLLLEDGYGLLLEA